MEGDALQRLQLRNLAVDVKAHGFGHRVQHLMQAAGNLHLGAVRSGQVDGHDGVFRLVRQHLRADLMGKDKRIQHVVNGIRVVAQQPLRSGDQLRARQVAVTRAAGRLAQRVLDARCDAVFAVALDAQRLGDPVRRPEAHALHIVHQPVGIPADDRLHILAVLLENLDR